MEKKYDQNSVITVDLTRYYAFEGYPHPTTIEYTGTVEDTLAKIHNSEDLIWSPPRLLRAVMEGNIPEKRRIELVNEVTACMLNMYEYGQNSAFDSVGESILKYLGNSAIHQEDDIVTRTSTTPGHALDAAERIHEKIDGDILFIPLCHGGVPAGMQTSLFLKRYNNADHVVQPIRFSAYKARDRTPLVTRMQERRLRALSKSRSVVVYDEDAASGYTVALAVCFFSQLLKTEDVIGMVNTDKRLPETIAEFGKYWENCAKIDAPRWYRVLT